MSASIAGTTCILLLALPWSGHICLCTSGSMRCSCFRPLGTAWLQKNWSASLDISYKTAWRMAHEIRKYMAKVDGDTWPLGGGSVRY